MCMEVGQQGTLALGQRTHPPTITHMYTLQQSNNDPILTQQPKTEEQEWDSQWQESLYGLWGGGGMIGDRGSEGRL